jgi:ribonuclease D
MPFHSPAQWFADAGALDDFASALPTSPVLGMDTEFMRRDTFYARLALLQLAAGHDIALVDPLTVGPSAALRERLEQPTSVCVMHSAGEDIEALSGWLPRGPAQLFDTQIAAAMAGMGAGLSYQKLVQAVTGVELPKDETRSDWLRRPLSDSQRQYAAQDVEYLHAIHAELHARLERLDRLGWLAEDCAKLCKRADHDAIDLQPQRALRGAADWPLKKQALLRRLLLWREHTARRLDVPRPWLIDDKLALSLADQPPRSPDELAERTRGQRALRSAVRQSLSEELARPLDGGEIEATAQIPAAPSRADRTALDALKQAVDAVAAELDIPAGLLCPRRLVEELLMTRAWPAALEGWRKPLLQPRLESLLP